MPSDPGLKVRTATSVFALGLKMTETSCTHSNRLKVTEVLQAQPVERASVTINQAAIPAMVTSSR